MAEGQARFDAINVGRMNFLGGAERTATFGALVSEQVALAGARAHDLAGGCDLKPLGHRLFGLNSFWTSHKYLP